MKQATRNKSRLVKISKILLVIFVTIFIGLAVAEAYFVFFNPQGATDFFKTDEYVGMIHKPNMEGIYSTREYSTPIKINSAGFRDNERTLNKDPNVTRIAVLGDSFVEAFQVTLDKSFPHILEEELNNNSEGKKYEVLNFGVSSFGTAQEYLMLKHYAMNYHPDIVILAFLTANDVSDNGYKLQKNHNNNVPYFILDSSNKLVQISSENRNISNSSANLAAFLRVFKSALGSIFPNTANFLVNFYNRKYVFTYKDALNVYSDNYSEEDWQDAWNVTKALILETKNFSEVNGARFVLVSLANNIQVNPGWWNETVKKYPEMADWNPEKPDKILEDFSSKNNISYIRLLPYFKDYYNRTGRNLYFYSDGHWNEEGQRLAAEAIYENLKYKLQ